MSHNCKEFDEQNAAGIAAGLPPLNTACSRHNRATNFIQVPIPDTACSNHNALRHGMPGRLNEDDLLSSIRMSAAEAHLHAERSESLEESNARFLFGVLNEAYDEIIRLRAEIERYKAMVASEHETLNGIIREGETPLDALRRVVGENSALMAATFAKNLWISEIERLRVALKDAQATKERLLAGVEKAEAWLRLSDEQMSPSESLGQVARALEVLRCAR